MKTILLTRGKVAVVDAQDFARFGRFRWFASESSPGRFYAARRSGPRFLYLHREILGVARGAQVDHEDRDGLNNRRSNLRAATQTQNNANQARRASQSGFKGVWPTKCGFATHIRKAGVRYYVGHFKTADDAARAYDSAARSLFGRFARTNFRA